MITIGLILVENFPASNDFCLLLLSPANVYANNMDQNQVYLLLRPFLCFMSLLYLDLYVLGDDALIS